MSSGTESAANTLTTSGTVNVTGTVTFEAGSSVILNPGFHVQSNSTFLARINACSPLIPNPTKNTTNIQYQLELASDIALSVFDMNGQEVSRLITKQYKEKGMYQMELNTNTFGSGIFYIVLISGDAVSQSQATIAHSSSATV